MRCEKKESSYRLLNEQVITLGEWGAVPLGTPGGQCGWNMPQSRSSCGLIEGSWGLTPWHFFFF